MTASTIAGVISEIRGRMRDVEKLATLVTDLIRSQFAAILGNVLVAIPTAMLLAALIARLTGEPIMRRKSAAPADRPVVGRQSACCMRHWPASACSSAG
jgi:site-specific recombinase